MIDLFGVEQGSQHLPNRGGIAVRVPRPFINKCIVLDPERSTELCLILPQHLSNELLLLLGPDREIREVMGRWCVGRVEPRVVPGLCHIADRDQSVEGVPHGVRSHGFAGL
ncbi:MAG: hypothetical protein BWY06_02740 [Candidatus Latescibacteria bacterium ADurb.Bin168]|nr:MAG: hypothetical protein BWY06_02740 [Candidatus Latescibacteria bacterium ADurb.Bin168]